MDKNNEKDINCGKLYRKGLTYAVSCSVLWGLLPIYWQSLKPIESTVILFYRIFLVCIVCGALSFKLYGKEEIKKHLKPGKAKLKFLIAGLMITFNWQLYVWAVNTNQVIQTCIGYYIEPLVIGIFGIIFFKEKLTKYKTAAIVFAIIGVIVILVHFMEVPVVALTLGISFAGYAVIKKNNRIPSILSLFYETMYLVIPALLGIIYLEVTGRGAFQSGTAFQCFLLFFSGPVTAATLALFSEAAGKLPLITLGLIEYIMPTISLIIGVFLFKEPFDQIQFIAFIIVWIGLGIFTIGEWKIVKTERKSVNIHTDARAHSDAKKHQRF